MFTGNCLCNQVRYGFETKPTNISICHCSICQHLTGSAFGAYVKVSEDDLTLTHGTKLLRSYAVTDKLITKFCKVCGSTVFANHSNHPGFAYISLGTMTEDSRLRPTYHEFFASKASWFDVQDSLPKFEEWADT